MTEKKVRTFEAFKSRHFPVKELLIHLHKIGKHLCSRLQIFPIKKTVLQSRKTLPNILRQSEGNLRT